jgi:hypothetical protein
MTNIQAAMIAAASTINPMNYSVTTLRLRAEEILLWIEKQECEDDTFG